ncbi:hypothetical protein [Sphingomonas sp. M1-B02]|uniref:hypothetical protein n=1 Tax=Sphingomonas sp. M1-B02 TaxID=3114300 RepID=UPI0022400132|nr:hypothetical protein [Sphingomonas sp. S6-11]UZK67537.1 hypothetical protein OKW87_06830 [Sphingomonas sp. S6-11]
MRRYATLLPLVLLASCEERRKPPAALWFEGLPVRGSAAEAQAAGFTRCGTVGRSLRCRREGVMVAGKGPYAAAVDLLYSDGSGGFDQLTVWDDRDQSAVNAVGTLLESQGWQLCRTGLDDNRGDQAIYTKAGVPVRFSIDLSYWGKRRLRILPETNQPKGKCW